MDWLKYFIIHTADTGLYINELKQGTHINKTEYAEFLDNSLNGYYLKYSVDGKIKWIYKFYNNHKNGDCLMYNYDLKLDTIISYKNGLLHGNTYTIAYDEYGDTLTYDIEMYNNNYITEIRMYGRLGLYKTIKPYTYILPFYNPKQRYQF